MSADMSVSDDDAITAVLEDWALATRTGAQDRVLKAFLSDALIYDVLAPMKYEGTEAYRASWGGGSPRHRGTACSTWRTSPSPRDPPWPLRPPSSDAAGRCRTAAASRTLCGRPSACAVSRMHGASRIPTYRSRSDAKVWLNDGCKGAGRPPHRRPRHPPPSVLVPLSSA